MLLDVPGNFVERAFSNKRNSAQLGDHELSSRLCIVIKRPIVLATGLLRNSCDLQGSLSGPLLKKFRDLWKGVEGRSGDFEG